MVFEVINRTTSVISKSVRLGPVMLVGVILIALSITGGAATTGLYIAAVGGLIIVLSASVEMFAYLQDSRRRFLKDRLYLEKRFSTKSAAAESDEIDAIRLELASIKKIVGHSQIITSQEKEALKTRLVLETEKQIKEEIADDILKRLSAAEHAGHHMSNIRSLASAMQVRLEEEVSALGSRANVNLIIGNAISFIGVAVLGYFVFTFPTEMLTSGRGLELIVYFLSRFSLVAFIEVFAYFFLRLYRYSIFEIKYFQNEMTTAQCRSKRPC